MLCYSLNIVYISHVHQVLCPYPTAETISVVTSIINIWAILSMNYIVHF